MEICEPNTRTKTLSGDMFLGRLDESGEDKILIVVHELFTGRFPL